MRKTILTRWALVWLAATMAWMGLTELFLEGFLETLAELGWLIGGMLLLLRGARRQRIGWFGPELPTPTRAGVWAIDREARTTYVNDHLAEMLGYSKEEMLGRSLYEFMDEDAEKLARASLERRREGEVEGLEFRFRRKDGSSVWTFLAARPLSDERGEYAGAVAVVSALAEIDQMVAGADEARTESERRFRELSETVRELFWVCDADFTRIHYVSDLYEEMFGKPVESLYADPYSFLEVVHPDDRERVRSALSEMGTGDYDVEYRIVRPDGEERWIWAKGFPVRDESGAIIRVTGVAEDITQRVRLQEELNQAQKMEAVGRLAGGVAHDFNNLLTVVNGYSDLLLQKLPADDPDRAVVSEIRQAGERATQLTRQLLAFGRRQMLQPRNVDVSAIVEGIRPLLARLIGEDVTLTVEVQPGLDPVHVDPTQLEQVLMNLVVNARDAMPSGGRLTIETSSLDVDAAYAARHAGVRRGHHIVLSVTDTGVGMDEATMARVFEPFFTTKAKGVGTGLGLSTVYGIVQQTGGHVWLYSEPGEGTTFKVLFPTVGARAEGWRPEESESAPRGGSETILLVEDDDAVRGFAAEILRGAGYTVIDAGDPLGALAVADGTKGELDLLLTDVVMPQISGRELADRLGKEDTGLRILYMSGYADRAIVHHGVLEEGTAFLAKPFVARQLLTKVREVLDAPPAS